MRDGKEEIEKNGAIACGWIVEISIIRITVLKTVQQPKLLTQQLFQASIGHRAANAV